MFGPTKTYRKWHRRVNKNQRRYALVSALAATSSTALVFARGHRIDQIPEVPLVVADKTITGIRKTKGAVAVLKTLNAYADIQRVIDSKKIRAGRGKMRNRRYVKRRGPLIIYDKESSFVRAFRNIPGIQFCSVHRLNLLKLAPGGHLGRFVIWTQSAFQQLDAIYGTYKKGSEVKVGFRLPRVALTNSDLNRLINSQEIQSHLRPKKERQRPTALKRNPLKNLGHLVRLNPYAKVQRAQTIKEAENAQKRKKLLRERRQAAKKAQAEGKEVPKAEKKAPQAKKNKDAVAYRKLFVKTLLS
jgi:large subunit ribosomal protein L4e